MRVWGYTIYTNNLLRHRDHEFEPKPALDSRYTATKKTRGAESERNFKHEMSGSLPEDARSRPPFTSSPSFEASYTASCHCSLVRFEVSGEPESVMYCHCESCQTIHGTPYQWAAVFHKDKVRITSSPETLRFYRSSPDIVDGDERVAYGLPCKISCRRCGAPICDEGRNMMMMMPTYLAFPRENEGRGGGGGGGDAEEGRKIVPLAFRAQHHMFYGKRVADMDDGLDKYVTKKGEGMCDYRGNPITGSK